MSDITCSECNGSGRVLKHYYNKDFIKNYKSAGSGMAVCPRCYGRGKVQGNISDSSTAGESSAKYIASLLLLLIVSGVFAAIAYRVFSTSTAGWFGFSVGIALSLLIPPVREAIIEMILGIALFVVVVVTLSWSVEFIFETFIDDTNGGEQNSGFAIPDAQRRANDLARKIVDEEMSKTARLNRSQVKYYPPSDTFITEFNARQSNDPAYTCKFCKSLMETGKDPFGKPIDPEVPNTYESWRKSCQSEAALRSCQEKFSISWAP